MHYSKKLQAAIEAIVIIAINGGGEPVNSKELCKLQGEKERYLEPIMQSLVHGQILRSVRGPKGGYVLTRERRKITLGEIAALIARREPKEEAEQECSLVKRQLIQPLWEQLYTREIEYLNQITLEDICKQIEPSQPFYPKNGDNFAI